MKQRQSNEEKVLSPNGAKTTGYSHFKTMKLYTGLTLLMKLTQKWIINFKKHKAIKSLEDNT